MACNYPYVLVRKDPILHVVPVPCGKCASCRKDRVDMWSDRVSFEALTAKRPSTFITLTFDEKYLPRDKSVHLSHIQMFHKNLRYQLSRTRNYDNPENKIRFFAASEYGEERFRPHYHFCVTNLDCYDRADFDAIYKSWREPYTKEPIGIITADSLLPARIRYCISYINFETPQQQKAYKALGLKPLIHTMSKGIGAKWYEEHMDMIKDQEGYYVHGHLRPLPYYFRKKYGMIEVNSYVKDLPNMWQKYNDRLISRGVKPIDPFNLEDIYNRDLLGQNSPECKRTRLQVLIGDEQKELSMCHKEVLRSSRKR